MAVAHSWLQWRDRWRCSLLFALLSLALMPAVAKASHTGDATGDGSHQILNVNFMVSGGEQREAYLSLVEAFEAANPDVQVRHREYEQETYKARMGEWLTGKDAPPDVLFWFAGEVLNDFVHRGLVRPIGTLWQQENWDAAFSPALKAVVSPDGAPVALPVAYYSWGLYYRKSLFERLGLQPPRTWNQLLAVGEALKGQGVVPVAVGSEAGWPLAAWFDYLDLRLNGLSFHQAVTAGHVPFTDPRLRHVMSRWKALIDANFFLANHARMSWRSALPYLYQNAAGMMLMGAFVKPQFPESIRDDIGVAPFPMLNPAIGRYEDAPTDVFFIPARASHPAAAERFLRFLAEPDTQSWINQQLGTTPPRDGARRAQDELAHSDRQILTAADGFAQFFDRDASRAFSAAAMPVFVRFASGLYGIDEALEQLETIRLTTHP
ncbi:ABC transporter substrate-binding protein [Marinobacter sp. C2H3]|uniref:ABC transporter substrate-binding protein n=1 Tax=Marinobacter sp. C2H3 TaxID=3119003 RepID=UPI00300F1982